MKVGIIQATTQIDKNKLLFETTKNVLPNDKVINFGVFTEDVNLSYVQIAVLIGLLINSGAVDYVITGCSSGNGMNIACNVMPNVISGYVPTPSDAYLFGKINQGNCASLPLGLNFGWAGELNLKYTIEKLFSGTLNSGYPAQMAERKKRDALTVKAIKTIAQNNMINILKKLNRDFIDDIYQKNDIFEYIFKYGTNNELIEYLKINK